MQKSTFSKLVKFFEENPVKTEVDENGVMTYFADNLNVKIRSNGEVIRDGSVYDFVNLERFSIYITAEKLKTPVSFGTLVRLMVLGDKEERETGTFRYSILNESIGLTKDNLVIVEKLNTERELSLKQFMLNLIERNKVVKVEKDFEYFRTVSKNTFYKTFDGEKFSDETLAKEYLVKLNKGLTNAKIVLDFKGGEDLAQTIFQQEVGSLPTESIETLLLNKTDLVCETEKFYMFDIKKLATYNHKYFSGKTLSKKFSEESARILEKDIVEYLELQTSWFEKMCELRTKLKEI